MSLTTRVVGVVGLMSFALTSGPLAANAGTATLYELTENMKLIHRNSRNASGVSRRIATSALTGLASPGSPLCPLPEFQSGELGCAVNVHGMDNISLRTGLGTFRGDFATVIQGDNPVDGPEAVVLRGEFQGQMNFAPAVLDQIPYGTVVGRVKSSRGGNAEFTGVFRLPFAGNVEVEVAPGVTLTLRDIFCSNDVPNVANPYTDTLYGGIDLKYLDTEVDPEAGETLPNGKCLNIEPYELSLGAPLVRFDIEF